SKAQRQGHDRPGSDTDPAERGAGQGTVGAQGFGRRPAGSEGPAQLGSEQVNDRPGRQRQERPEQLGFVAASGREWPERETPAVTKQPAIESPASAGLFFVSAFRNRGDLDRGQTAEAERARRRRREIDDAAAHERSAVVDPHGYAFSVALVGYLNLRPEWKRAMRRGQSTWIGSLAGRGF